MGFKFWRSWRPDQLKLKSPYSGEFLFLVYKLVCWIWGICNKNPQRKKKGKGKGKGKKRKWKGKWKNTDKKKKKEIEKEKKREKEEKVRKA